MSIAIILRSVSIGRQKASENECIEKGDKNNNKLMKYKKKFNINNKSDGIFLSDKLNPSLDSFVFDQYLIVTKRKIMKSFYSLSITIT